VPDEKDDIAKLLTLGMPKKEAAKTEEAPAAAPVEEPQEEEAEDVTAEGDAEGEEVPSEESGEAGGAEAEEAGEEGTEETDPEKIALRKQIAELQAQVEAKETEAAPAEEEPEETVEAVDFLKDDEAYTKAVESRESFNTLLNEVYKQATIVAARLVMRRMGPLVQREVAVASANETIIRDFYRRHDDLLPVRKYVGMVFTEMRAKNPSKTAVELLDVVAARVRNDLGLPRRAGAGKQPGGGAPPAKARSAPAGRAPVTKTAPSPSLAEELAKMSRLR